MNKRNVVSTGLTDSKKNIGSIGADYVCSDSDNLKFLLTETFFENMGILI